MTPIPDINTAMFTSRLSDVMVTWEEALDLVAGKIREVISKYGPAAIGGYNER